MFTIFSDEYYKNMADQMMMFVNVFDWVAYLDLNRDSYLKMVGLYETWAIEKTAGPKSLLLF